MKIRSIMLAAVAAISLSTSANAVVIFSDNFNTETLSLNYTGFANWSVTAGSVDLIGTPGFFDFYPGNGRYVDMDGTMPGITPAGQITSNVAFGAGSYNLMFLLGGSTRGDTNTVTAQLGSFTTSITLTPGAGLLMFSFNFATTGGNLVFTNLGSSDNLGLILDDVKLSSGVPEPATWAMMLLGFLGLGALYSRSRRAQARAATA